MANEKVKCGLYVRVSSRNQLETEYNSMETQKEKLEAYCKSQEGYEVYKIYEDGAFSADSLDRPQLQAMLNDIRQGRVNCVVAYKIDRLTRSVKDFHALMEIFEKFNVSFVSTTQAIDTKSPTGRLMRNILLDFAQFEREMTADRTRDKMHQRAEKGMWNGGVAPYGYKAQNKKLVINGQEAPTVTFMFEQYAKEASFSKLREKLNLKGYRNRLGKEWGKTVVMAILKNPVYSGVLRFNKKVFKGEHEAIITETLFSYVQNLHPQRTHARTKSTRRLLLRGLVKCADCGCYMTPHYTSKRRKDGTVRPIWYYRCTRTTHFSNKVCKVKQMNADKAEAFVEMSLNELAVNANHVERTVKGLNATLEGKTAGLEREAERLKGFDLPPKN